MDEHQSWYNGSVWHIVWPDQVYVGQWPIFYGPAILLHILKTIWWRNVVLGDNGSVWLKDRPCKMYVCQWPLFHGLLILPYIIVRLKLFLYIKKWHRPGYSCPSGPLLYLCPLPFLNSVHFDLHFRRNIQSNPEGHSSVEDAIATMELVLLKLRNGA